LHSVWYEPPADGKPEPCDARRVALGSLIMRPLHEMDCPRVAVCDFGALGTMELWQADCLAPLQFASSEDVQNPDANVSFADALNGGTLFQKPTHSVPLSRPSYAFSLFGERSVGGKWAILRLKQTGASAKVKMK